MKKEDIRIGNFIKEKDNTYIVASINTDDTIRVYNNDKSDTLGCYVLKWFQPIPLTEEWLLKFGFKLIRRANYVNYDFDEWRLGEFELEDFIYRGSVEKDLKYVHELQNLYWCLCQKELILNN